MKISSDYWEASNITKNILEENLICHFLVPEIKRIEQNGHIDVR